MQWQFDSCALFPSLGPKSIVDANHCDAIVHGTNERTKIAADAFGFIDARNACKRCWIGAVRSRIDCAFFARYGSYSKGRTAASLDVGRRFM